MSDSKGTKAGTLGKAEAGVNTGPADKAGAGEKAVNGMTESNSGAVSKAGVF